MGIYIMSLYGYLNIDITKVENIKEIVNNKIDSSCSYLDEIQDIEGFKSEMINFALDIRTQMNLLSSAIDDLNSFNTSMLLNGSKLPNEHINPLFDIEFKKELLSHRL
jgi:hypothetical protein